MKNEKFYQLLLLFYSIGAVLFGIWLIQVKVVGHRLTVFNVIFGAAMVYTGVYFIRFAIRAIRKG